MVHLLSTLAVGCTLFGLGQSTYLPTTVQVEPLKELPLQLESKLTYRQASRDSINRRAEARQVAKRYRALEPRQSATVYPTCTSSLGDGYIPQSGFASFPDWALTNGGQDISGAFTNNSPTISCVMLCETTSSCTAGTWYNGNTCVHKQGTITGANMSPRPNSDRETFIKGTCSSLEAQINNSTIMASCCNNPAPSTVARCTTSYYQNLGNYCVKTRNQYTGTNLVSTQTVAGGNDFDQLFRNCAAACTSYTQSQRNSNGSGCTIATAAYNTNGGANCRLYGGQVKTMVASDAEFTLALLAGTCEQADANGIPASRTGGCYSPTSGGL